MLPTVLKRDAEPRLDSLDSTKTPSFLALPGARVRLFARLICQGRALRSRERKLRGLDSARGKAQGTATKGIASFFQAEITPEKRKKEGTKCQKDNTPLGEDYCGRQSKSQGECSLTPPFTITAFYVFPNIKTTM
jgi:hypothetical protein